ncbi:spermidine resistance protein [Borealophlyctis nickersoniae]|nr:spermidine resistance protein [Borealophlyctis nickersoniae]
MFVYPNRLILKTCGTTTLLHAVPRILAIAAEHCGLRDVNAVFYSRKAFLFPEKQAWPHGRWGDEVSYLDELFPADTFETAGYVLGKINGDHWCLYMATPLQLSLDLDGVEIADSTSSRSDSDGESSSPEDDDEEDDVTLEIMMTNLNSSAMKQFWRTEEEKRAIEVDGERGLKEGAQRVYRQTGIANIYPNAVVDDYLFDPCGYSLNGLVGPYYFTIHVTPEDHCSYASFETTVPVKRFHQHSHGGSESEYDSFDDLIGRVVDVFRPGQFSTTLFTRRSAGHKHRNAAGVLDGNIKGFRRRDRIVQSLGKWDLIFCHYDQGFTGGGKNKKVAGKKGLAAR